MFIAHNDWVATTVGTDVKGNTLRLRAVCKLGEAPRQWEAAWFRKPSDSEPFLATEDRELILAWMLRVEVYGTGWTPSNRGTLATIVLDPSRFFEFVGGFAVAHVAKVRDPRFVPAMPSGSLLN